jgi:hypothetical protein
LHLGSVDDGGLGRPLGIDDRYYRGRRHLLLELADLEDEIDLRVPPDRDDDVSPDRGFEADKLEAG